MKHTIPFIFSVLFLIGCQEEATTEETTETVTVEETQDIPETIEEVHQSNVVTPEFWEDYETDVRVVFFYSKVENSPPEISSVKKDLLLGEANGEAYEFHEYHTDENMGMVQVDDNVFFNLTEYLWNNEQGFVLLKKGAILHIPAGEVDSDTGVGTIFSFFED